MSRWIVVPADRYGPLLLVDTMAPIDTRAVATVTDVTHAEAIAQVLNDCMYDEVVADIENREPF